jgi:hypothetical protein
MARTPKNDELLIATNRLIAKRNSASVRPVKTETITARIQEDKH